MERGPEVRVEAPEGLRLREDQHGVGLSHGRQPAEPAPGGQGRRASLFAGTFVTLATFTKHKHLGIKGGAA